VRHGLAVASARRRWPFWCSIAAALLLHAGVAWWLLPHGAGRGGVVLGDPPMIEIEMVEQAQQEQGRPATGTPPPEAAAVAAAAKPQPPQEDGDPSPPSAPQPPQPSPPAPPAPPAPPTATPAATPAVNLGNADEDQGPLSVTGSIVVPPRPDAVFHNKPPGYPADAAKRRHEGTVLVRARVTEAGVPGQVDVVTSSGDASLDRAARDAVQLWRFEPARSNGVPVPFDYDVNIRFSLSDR